MTVRKKKKMRELYDILINYEEKSNSNEFLTSTKEYIENSHIYLKVFRHNR